jgi:hypothetical protein
VFSPATFRRAKLGLAAIAIFAISAFGGAVVTAPRLADPATETTVAFEDRTTTSTPRGLRNAATKTQEKMTAAARRADYETGRRYAWLVSEPPNQTGFGTICGRSRGLRVTPLKRTAGTWKVDEASSGGIQTYLAACEKAD